MKNAASYNAGDVFVPVKHLSRHARIVHVSMGIGALLLGVMVYLIDRSPGSVYFVPSWLSMSGYFNQVFGVVGNYLPTFVHPFAFILLTLAFVKPGNRNLLAVCATWFIIDCLFEIAQMTAVAQWLITIIPAFNNIPILENTQNYLVNGTFDVLDVMSIMLGTMAAYFVVRNTTGTQKRE